MPTSRPLLANEPRPSRELPTLAELGADLLTTTPWQRRWALARPLLLVLCFAAVWQSQLWWLTPLVMFLLFIAIVTVTHDVVHGALGLSPRQSEWWLFLLGVILLESGHAYRATHHQHHRVFPGPDDPEGDPARMNLWTAVLWGPLFLPRLWLWAYRRNQGRDDQRRWLVAEAIWAIGFPLAAATLWPITKGPAVYALLAIVGSWVYPLLTVHLPHHGYGDTPLTQTGTLRGLIIPRLFLELTYHLEHHLYPTVPSHHLANLSKRLDPTLRANGVTPKWAP
ncbi:MAG: fatty acid desaturase [Pirellulaceae bacterium]|nr:fatty acid desaturase [Pirellulaceae bacterium]